MILSSEGRSSGVLSILQDSVFPSAVAPRSLFRFGDGRDCVEDELEDLWFRLDIRQLFYAPNITFRTLHSYQANKNYGAEKTPPSAILLVLGPENSFLLTCPYEASVNSLQNRPGRFVRLWKYGHRPFETISTCPPVSVTNELDPGFCVHRWL